MVVVRGRLRLYSASGFFLFLGLIILAIGIGMATLGYWPHNKAIPTGRGNELKVEKDVTNASQVVQGNNSSGLVYKAVQSRPALLLFFSLLWF